MRENISDVKNKRKRFYISKSFQSRFIAKFCLLVICASLLSGALIYYFNQKTTTIAFDHLKVVVKSTADFILPAMLEILVSVTFIIIIATIAVTLFTSHKLVGPLYRVELEIDKIKRGNLSIPIHIREKDQTKRLAASLEEMRVTFQAHTTSLKRTGIQSSLF